MSATWSSAVPNDSEAAAIEKVMQALDGLTMQSAETVLECCKYGLSMLPLDTKKAPVTR